MGRACVISWFCALQFQIFSGRNVRQQCHPKGVIFTASLNITTSCRTSLLPVVIDLPSTELCDPIYSDFDIINSWRAHIEMISSLVETATRLSGQPAAR
jgi:hypothetical protein